MAAALEHLATARRAQVLVLDSRDLNELRAELDRIDDALHDLLMARAETVEEVGALRAKGNVPLRPGREAAILRRLLQR
ncbi:MAG: chorismate mutase, partial [Sinobacteraceae bacterium]|nr:chorismate mutase [Nevskiaceae bacterium]